MPPINRAQRAVLMLMLVIDGLLCAFPPFDSSAGIGTHYRYPIGHYWLFASDRGVSWYRCDYSYGRVWPFTEPGYDAHVSFAQLALEIFIVTIIGATAVMLARSVLDQCVPAAWRRGDHGELKPAPWFIAAVAVGALLMCAAVAAQLMTCSPIVQVD